MPYEKRANRRPGPAAVVVGSIALFAVLFAVIAFQVGGGTAGAQIQATGETAAASAREAESSLTATDSGGVGEGDSEGSSEETYEEPTFAEEEAYAEPLYAEEETYVEPYVEEAPPVTTGAS